MYLVLGKHRRKIAASIILWLAVTALFFWLHSISVLITKEFYSAIYIASIACLSCQFYWIKAEVPENYWPSGFQDAFASNHRLRRSLFVLTGFCFVVAISGIIQIFEKPSDLGLLITYLLILLTELAIFADTVVLFRIHLSKNK